MTSTKLLVILACALLVVIPSAAVAAEGDEEADATAGPYCVDLKPDNPTDPVDVYECSEP